MVKAFCTCSDWISIAVERGKKVDLTENSHFCKITQYQKPLAVPHRLEKRSMEEIDVPHLPAELTEFVPENFIAGLHALSSWELRANKFDDNVEISNAFFSRDIIAFLAFTTVALIGGCGYAAVDMFMTGAMLGAVSFAFIGFFTVGWIVVMFIRQALSNRSLWKGKVRFQYNKSSGELFFLRENAHYSRDGYDVLLFGTTDGYDTVNMLEYMKKWKVPIIELVTQSYFLVRRKDGTWVRHLVGYDRYMNPSRAAVKIQRAMRCRMVKRKMSMQECYALQHKTATAGVDPRPRRSLFCVYFLPSIFMAFGLVVIGVGLHGLFWHAADPGTCHAVIFGGSVYCLFALLGMLAYRYVYAKNNPAGPYTPSAPVFCGDFDSH